MSVGTWQGGLLAWVLYLLGTTTAMAVALVWGRGRRTGMEDEMDVEIARYPMRCHRCGRTEQVRVFAVAAYDPSVMCRNELLTRREAPEGWTWERDEDGQPRWVCPSCAAHDCGHCTHIRASEQDGAMYCHVAGREVCPTDQPCEFFSGLGGE